MQNGSFKLFRAFGIDVFLHWSWFLMAVLIIPRMGYFTGPDALVWKSLLFVSLFVIVILHEFGHALACRSVGGQARNIVLWPLGGVAFVNPPARPGAVLWSIAAGPLVNVVLIPVTVLAYLAVDGWSIINTPFAGTDLQLYVFAVMVMNLMLLIFNMLPVYPLDGGQVLMSLLWFVVGRVKALKIASFIGLIAAGGLGVLALMMGDMWLLLMTAFVGWQAFNGFRLANAMARMDPRRFDERLAKQHQDQSVDDRVRADVDPWR
ncbi:site-2 protease family protein [Phycisphaeraceae bacterium D3-23]